MEIFDDGEQVLMICVLIDNGFYRDQIRDQLGIGELALINLHLKKQAVIMPKKSISYRLTIVHGATLRSDVICSLVTQGCAKPGAPGHPVY